MKIFIICSKYFYDRIEPVRKKLEENGHTIILPNCYENPFEEDKVRQRGEQEHAEWKARQYKKSENKIRESDALLVLNYEKNGQPNYVGGATFLEMYDGFKLGKLLYMYNPAPENLLKDEIIGMNPVVLKGDLEKILES